MMDEFNVDLKSLWNLYFYGIYGVV